MSTTPPSAPPSFLASDGEMAARIRAFDWAATPLGAPARWRPSLRAMVRLALAARQPVFVFWGPDHLCLYNDAARALLTAAEHPALAGGVGRDRPADRARPARRERAQGGLGIGLSLSQELAALHGGRVEAFSDRPGRGSTFRLTLPINADLDPAIRDAV